MEAPRLDLLPFGGSLEETRAKINDIKKVAVALLGDHLVLKEEEMMRRDIKQLEEKEEVYSQVALLRETMRACLKRLKVLDSQAPELNDRLVKIIADL
ncbi:hypothetical protein KKA33_03950 [Patescibacteria group bacterium]|nr:hypothetical protein [Patescibacteria group bacterium]